ncbi:MAG: ribosome biogenesis GTPase YlqF [Clostridia bacterium]|nr:ribosome biogenesis GTPase YlqF [Clostridia bacterium]
MNLQWFPGHMAKTRKLMAQSLKIVDVVAELVDARLPLSSRNPEIDKIVGNKPRVLILNKADMADEKATKAWIEYFKKQGIKSIAVNSISGKGLEKIGALLDEALAEKRERDINRGINRSVKMMVCGIPNVGKSSIINKIAGRAGAKTGDRPGVTKSQQWIRLKDGIEMLDMPGVLWPKFDSEQVALRLAFTGAIKDEIMDVEELACYLLDYLKTEYPMALMERYKLEIVEDKMGYEILEDICKKRGFLLGKGEFDYFRGANILLNEFRDCKIGRITLEMPKGE